MGRDRDYRQYDLENQSKNLGISDKTYFLGFKSPIKPWIAACDILLAPAVGDAFGRSLVEAMLVGTPTVASQSAGHIGIIEEGQTGLFALPDEPTNMAGVVGRLLSDPIFTNKLTENARISAQTRYSVSGHVQKICRIYNDLLSGPN